MDATGMGLGWSGTRRLRPLLVAAACLAASAMEVGAAPIRGGARLAAQELRVSNSLANPGLSPAWNAFLGLGPDGWAARQAPSFTVPTRLAVWRMLEAASHSTSLDPMLEYLMWRRDLNSARFDRNHPFLGPRLGQLLRPPSPLVPPIDVPEVPPITPPPSLVAPDNPVPEPGGLLIAALASAWGLWRRRSRAVSTR